MSRYNPDAVHDQKSAFNISTRFDYESMAESLPEEVLQLIFSFLQPVSTPTFWQGCSHETALLHRTLAAICQASKTFHRLATPFLYHTIQVYSSPRYSHAEPELSGLESNTTLLLDSLLGREHSDQNGNLRHRQTDLSRTAIGRRVKHMIIEWFELIPPDATEKCKADLDTFLLEGGERPYLGDTWLPDGVAGMPEDHYEDLDWQVYDAAEDGNLREEIIWHLGDAFATGTEDAEVAMILMLCRDGLETLDLTAVPGIRHSLVMDVVEDLLDAHQTAPHSQAPFHSLRLLRVRGENSPLGLSTYHFGDLSPFLRLPSIETLRTHGMHCVMKHNPPRMYPSISRIQILDGVLNADGLEDILCSCPNLVELEVSAEGSIEDDTDWEEIEQCLKDRGQRLTKLIMEMKSSYRGRLLSVRGLTSLRHFGTNISMLLGHEHGATDDTHVPQELSRLELTDLLPSTLEILEVRNDDEAERKWCSEQDDKQIVKLLADTAFSELKEVILHLGGDSFHSKEYVEPLGWVQETNEAGVNLRKISSGIRLRHDSALDVQAETPRCAVS